MRAVIGRTTTTREKGRAAPTQEPAGDAHSNKDVGKHTNRSDKKKKITERERQTTLPRRASGREFCYASYLLVSLWQGVCACVSGRGAGKREVYGRLYTAAPLSYFNLTGSTLLVSAEKRVKERWKGTALREKDSDVYTYLCKLYSEQERKTTTTTEEGKYDAARATRKRSGRVREGQAHLRETQQARPAASLHPSSSSHWQNRRNGTHSVIVRVKSLHRPPLRDRHTANTPGTGSRGAEGKRGEWVHPSLFVFSSVYARQMTAHAARDDLHTHMRAHTRLHRRARAFLVH